MVQFITPRNRALAKNVNRSFGEDSVSWQEDRPCARPAATYRLLGPPMNTIRKVYTRTQFKEEYLYINPAFASLQNILRPLLQRVT